MVHGSNEVDGAKPEFKRTVDRSKVSIVDFLISPMLRQISLSMLGLSVGGVLTVVGFVAYFITNNPTLNLAGFFYGIPLLLGGLALKAAELKPVPYLQPTSDRVNTLREQQANPTQLQIRKDVTSYRYGQKAHFERALNYLGLSPTDEERPVLVGIQEGETNGRYTLMLEFESPFMPLETWQKKLEKVTGFFGSGIQVAVSQVGGNGQTGDRQNRIKLELISTAGEA